ncbi:MAG: hypothetical protein DWQ37_03445 [Planctomycetota bacterium]|nr:MAG: hypothetical protein DWQ37_03445 [Planctomycetota bacterium]
MLTRVAVLVAILVCSSHRVAAAIDADDIVNGIRASESLFEDFEATLHTTYTLLRDPYEFVGENTREITHSHSVVTYTLQQGMFRLEVEKAVTDTSGDTPRTQNRLRLFDGIESRAKEGRVVNLVDGFTNDANLVRPHMMIVQAAAYDVPLSIYLSGKEAILAFAGEKAIGNTRISIDYEGEDRIEGYKCHELVCRHSNISTGAVASVVHLWLVPDRSWLPIRCVVFDPRRSESRSIYESATTEFLEVGPSIWIPKRARCTAFDKRIVQSRAEQVAVWQQTCTVKSCNLNPNHPVSYFREFDIPAGTAVYQLDLNGEIVGSHRERAISSRWQAPIWPLLLLGGAVFGLFAFLFWRKCSWAAGASR